MHGRTKEEIFPNVIHWNVCSCSHIVTKNCFILDSIINPLLKVLKKLTPFLFRNEKSAEPQHSPIQILALNEKETHQKSNRRQRKSGKPTKREKCLPNPEFHKPSSVSTTTSLNSSRVTENSRRKNSEIVRKREFERRTFFKKRTHSKQKKSEGKYFKELSSTRILGK